MEKKYYIFKFNLIIMNIFAIILLSLMLYLTDIIDEDLLKIFMGNVQASKWVIYGVLYILYLFLHEIIHGLSYIVGGADPKKVVFGIVLEKSIFYCLCKQDISIKAAKNSVMSPFLYIGVLTYIIGVIFHFPILTILSIANIAGAAGDLIVYAFLSKLNKNSKFSEFDDSTSFAILSNKDISKSKTLGLRYFGSRKTIERKDLKRIDISKSSGLIITIMLLGGLLILLYEKGVIG